MVNAPVNVLVALDRLSGNPDFKLVMDHLQVELNMKIKQLLWNSVTVSVHQDQGYASALTDILQLAATARESLASLGQ